MMVSKSVVTPFFNVSILDENPGRNWSLGFLMNLLPENLSVIISTSDLNEIRSYERLLSPSPV